MPARATAASAHLTRLVIAGQRFPILLLALYAIGACTSSSENSPGPAPTPMGRTFVSTSVDGAPIPGGGPLTLTFKDNRVSATAGCNTYSSTVALDDHKVKVSGLAGTLMACPGDRADADERLIGLLNSSPEWQLDDTKLTLHGHNLTVHLLDKKVAQPDKPLIGTTWIVTGLITPDAKIRSQTIDEVKPTLTIAADGAVSGTAGCNRLIGMVTVGGADVTFQVGTTKMLCPPEVMEVESDVLKALNGKTTVTIDADTLTLRNTTATASLSVLSEAVHPDFHSEVNPLGRNYFRWVSTTRSATRSGSPGGAK